MARTDNVWESRAGGYIETTNPLGYDVLINGSNKYLNFNTLSGSTGYGFRDNNGTLEGKNSGGVWAPIDFGGGSELFADGTVAAPSIAFTNNPSTGIYHSGSGATSMMAFALNGVQVGRFYNGGYRYGTVGTDLGLPMDIRGNSTGVFTAAMFANEDGVTPGAVQIGLGVTTNPVHNGMTFLRAIRNNVDGSGDFSILQGPGASVAVRNTFYIKGSNGNVGIGTTTPGYQLEISDDANTATKGLLIGEHSSGIGAAISIFQKSRGTKAAPSAVAGGDYAGVTFFQPWSATSLYMNTASIGARISGTITGTSVPTDIFFATSGGTNDSDPLASGNVRMLIAAGGNVGIGTGSTIVPGAKLHVAFPLTASATTINEVGDYAGYFQIGTSTSSNNGDKLAMVFNLGGLTATPHISTAIEAGREATGWNTYMAFYTNNVTSGAEGVDAIQEKMRITSAGYLGVGTSDPRERLTLPWGNKIGFTFSDAQPLVYNYISKPATGNSALTFAATYGPPTTDVIFNFIKSGSTSVLAILQNGNVGLGTSTPAALLSLGSTYNAAKLHVYDDLTYTSGLAAYSPDTLRIFGDALNRQISFGSQTRAGVFTETMRIKGDNLEMTGRLLQKQGADVASANNLVLGVDGNTFEITGTTQINLISNLTWQNGAKITLLFTSTPVVKHNQTTSTTNITIQLAGSGDFAASAGDTLTLVLSEIGGTQAWRECSRTAI